MPGDEAQAARGVGRRLSNPPLHLMVFEHFADKKQAHRRIERTVGGAGRRRVRPEIQIGLRTFELQPFCKWRFCKWRLCANGASLMIRICQKIAKLTKENGQTAREWGHAT